MWHYNPVFLRFWPRLLGLLTNRMNHIRKLAVRDLSEVSIHSQITIAEEVGNFSSKQQFPSPFKEMW